MHAVSECHGKNTCCLKRTHRHASVTRISLYTVTKVKRQYLTPLFSVIIIQCKTIKTLFLLDNNHNNIVTIFQQNIVYRAIVSTTSSNTIFVERAHSQSRLYADNTRVQKQL